MYGMREVEFTPELPPAFVTLEEIKAYLGITDTAQDATLQRLAEASGAILERYCGRLLKARTVVETVFPKDAVENLVLSHTDVNAFTSLDVDGVVTPNGELFVAKKIGAIRREDGGVIVGKKIIATYTTKDVAGTDALKTATLELIRDMHAAKSQPSGVTRETVEGVGTVEYASGGSDLMRNGSGVSLPASVAVAVSAYVRRVSI